MKPILLMFLFAAAAVFKANAQVPTQTVKGTVIDRASERPIAGITVQVAGMEIGSTTDSAGRFYLPKVPLGRIHLSFSSISYKPVTIPEIMVTAGKEVVVDIALEESITSLAAVSVSANRAKKGMASNEFAGSSSRSFRMEDVTRYAGGRNDPSRLASNFAGVATTDDSRNDVVVRGNSPSALLWRMEGIPIPNPNHFANMGTTGGPTSAINTNALKNSDFYTSAFAAEYGNVVGGIFDLNLRTGNKDKYETLIQLNLFSGLEAMLEGPMGKKGGSFLIGYRYSFAAIGQSIGLDIGTDATPRYQDLVFNLQFPKTKAGTFNIFGMWGNSNIDLIGDEIDTTDLFANKNEDLYFKSRLAIVGVNHRLELGNTSYWRNVLSFSSTQVDGDLYRYYDSLPERRFESQQRTGETGFRWSSYVNSKWSAKTSFRAGFLAEALGIDSWVTNRVNKPDWEDVRNYDDRNLLLQPFVQLRHRLTEKWSFTAGLHGTYYSLNSSSAIEPRAAIAYAINNNQSLNIGFGLHSQLQPSPVYLYQMPKEDGSYDLSNRDLGLTKARHFVLGYEWRLAADWRLKAEAYYQSLYNVPVERIASGFSVLNAGADFIFPNKGGLVNEGTGRNQGFEFTIEKFFSKGVYVLGTASIFDASYVGSDGVRRNSTFNNKTVFNVLAGREFKMGKKGKNRFTIDMKMASSGGRYYTPVDLMASIAANEEELDETRYNSERLPNYFRLDLRFGIQLNSSSKKVSHSFFLDFQNITNRDNVFTQRYNVVKKEVGTLYQTGFFPDILYRFQF